MFIVYDFRVKAARPCITKGDRTWVHPPAPCSSLWPSVSSQSVSSHSKFKRSVDYFGKASVTSWGKKIKKWEECEKIAAWKCWWRFLEKFSKQVGENKNIQVSNLGLKVSNKSRMR